MGITTIFKLGEAVVGVCTGNPVMIYDGMIGAAQSYLTGLVMSPITEPLKEFVGEAIGDADWAEIAETCPTW